MTQPQAASSLSASPLVAYDPVTGYPALTGEITIDALLGDGEARWNWRLPYGSPVEVTFSFRDSAPGSNYGYDIYDFRPLTGEMQTAVRQILAQYSAQTGLTFREVPAADGAELNFGMYSGRTGIPAGIPNDGEAIPPYEYFSGRGDVWINWTSADAEDLIPISGNDGYFLLTHETGHALGLKHPGQYNYFDQGPFLPENLDNTSFTIMSYYGGGPDNGPQVLDIQALQFLYGTADASLNTTPVVGYVDGVNVYDIDSSIFPGVSSIYEIHYTGQYSANLTGTNAHEIIFGSALEFEGDYIAGNGGNDIIYGRLGDDDLYGNIGFDILYGGQQNDRLFGGKDVDAVYGNLGDDVAYGNFGNDALFGGQGADTLWGGRDDDTLQGNLGNDVLIGNQGSDVMIGGGGADVFFVRQGPGTDTIVDFNSAQGDSINAISSQIAGIVNDGSGNALIQFGDGGLVIVSGVDAASVSASLFLV